MKGIEDEAINFCYGFFAVISISAFLLTLNSIVREKEFYKNSNFNKSLITQNYKTAYQKNPKFGEAVRVAYNEQMTKTDICQTCVYPEIATGNIAGAYSEIANDYNKNCEQKAIDGTMDFYEGR